MDSDSQAFTEQGVAMLSSVLRSPRAVEVNIAIMRTFVQLRRLMDSNALLAEKIEALEEKYADHDQQFQLVFEAIKQLISTPSPPAKELGFHTLPSATSAKNKGGAPSPWAHADGTGMNRPGWDSPASPGLSIRPSSTAVSSRPRYLPIPNCLRPCQSGLRGFPASLALLVHSKLSIVNPPLFTSTFDLSGEVLAKTHLRCSTSQYPCPPHDY
jgi:hypothetical protein